jgi:hypothetical protein
MAKVISGFGEIELQQALQCLKNLKASIVEGTDSASYEAEALIESLENTTAQLESRASAQVWRKPLGFACLRFHFL